MAAKIRHDAGFGDFPTAVILAVFDIADFFIVFHKRETVLLGLMLDIAHRRAPFRVGLGEIVLNDIGVATV